jgi:hypothetical protein
MEFIFNKFFLIARLMIFTGVVLCLFAVASKKGNNDIVNNNVIIESTDIRDNEPSKAKESISKHNRKLEENNYLL